MKQLKSINDIKNQNYILKLGANWCSPCKLEDSILEKESICTLSKQKSIDIYKVDVDDDQFENLLDEYEVSSIPVLLYFKNNEFKHKTVNLQTEQQVLDNINRIY